MKSTTNYGLSKTELTDDIPSTWEAINQSMDKIDEKIKTHCDNIDDIKSKLSQYVIITNGSDMAATINNALTLYKRVFLLDGVYNVSSTVIIPSGSTLEISDTSVIKPTTNINVIQVKPGAILKGGSIDINNLSSFTNACIYLNGEDIFFSQKTQVSNISLIGKNGNAWGSAIRLKAQSRDLGQVDSSFKSFQVCWVRFENITIKSFDKGLELTAVSVHDPSYYDYINGNFFNKIAIWNCKYSIYVDGDATNNNDCDGNTFTDIQIQNGSLCDTFIYCNGKYNSFSVMPWDLAGNGGLWTSKGFVFTSTSAYNSIPNVQYGSFGKYTNDTGYCNCFSGQTPNLDVLPTASVLYRNRMLIQTGYATADKLYICLKSATGTYSWVQIAAG